ncbi:hypothetical protein [Lactobacillus helveticus]|uniref:hypothetical protein n=1 Tax=Lactobacillus helveticus TaxID=1587 RepID=UPI00156718F5|nr:hypothetical protein [Lactobacillus helveticus]
MGVKKGERMNSNKDSESKIIDQNSRYALISIGIFDFIMALWAFGKMNAIFIGILFGMILSIILVDIITRRKYFKDKKDKRIATLYFWRIICLAIVIGIVFFFHVDWLGFLVSALIALFIFCVLIYWLKYLLSPTFMRFLFSCFLSLVSAFLSNTYLKLITLFASQIYSHYGNKLNAWYTKIYDKKFKNDNN